MFFLSSNFYLLKFPLKLYTERHDKFDCIRSNMLKWQPLKRDYSRTKTTILFSLQAFFGVLCFYPVEKIIENDQFRMLLSRKNLPKSATFVTSLGLAGLHKALIYCTTFHSWASEYVACDKFNYIYTGYNFNISFYLPGGRPEYVSNLSVETTLTLQPAYREPRYTNYVSCFYGTIDYIFHDRQKLETVKTVAFPPHSDVLENTACPSVKFPSDHMALVCELKWKDV